MPSFFDRNKVAPKTPEKDFEPFASLWYTSDLPAIYIRIDGVGNTQIKIKSHSTTVRGKNITSIRSPYLSNGILSDFLDVKANTKQVASGKKPLFSVLNYRHSTVRKDTLFNQIKQSLTRIEHTTDTPPRPVIVIGLSHGSVVTHTVILRLKMDPDITTEQLGRLYVLTLGSPQYLPVDLLPAPGEGQRPKIINVYNMDDEIVNIFHNRTIEGNKTTLGTMTRGLFAKAFITNRVPPKSQWDNIKTSLIGQLTSFGNPLAVGAYDTMKSIYYIKFRDLSEPNHANWRSLCHIIDNAKIDIPAPNNTIGALLNFIFHPQIFLTRKEASTVIVGGMMHPVVITMLKDKKTYKVKEDRQTKQKYIMMNKVKTYLKDLKGKYRYVR